MVDEGEFGVQTLLESALIESQITVFVSIEGVNSFRMALPQPSPILSRAFNIFKVEGEPLWL